MTTDVKIEKIDREAAATFLRRNYGEVAAQFCLHGKEDMSDLVQAFARHRLAERAAVVAKLREVAGPLPPKSPTHGEVWVLHRAADVIDQGRHHDD